MPAENPHRVRPIRDTLRDRYPGPAGVVDRVVARAKQTVAEIRQTGQDPRITVDPVGHVVLLDDVRWRAQRERLGAETDDALFELGRADPDLRLSGHQTTRHHHDPHTNRYTETPGPVGRLLRKTFPRTAERVDGILDSAVVFLDARAIARKMPHHQEVRHIGHLDSPRKES